MLANAVNQVLSAFGVRLIRVETLKKLQRLSEKGRQWNEMADIGHVTPVVDDSAGGGGAEGLEQRIVGQLTQALERQRVTLLHALHEQSHRYAYLGGHHGLTQTIDGHRIFVDTRDLGLAPHLVLLGVWERAIEQVVKRLVKPGDTVIEVGANVGYHTLAMASVIGPQGRLWTFEANPDLHPLLQATFSFNGYADRVTLLPFAASDREGTITFSFDPSYIGGGHITGEIAPKEASSRVTVPTVTLDKQFADLPAINFLRMDAEGAEPRILRGGRELLRRSANVKIVVEWSPSMMSDHCDVPAFVAEMEQEGYRFWRINGDETLSVVTPEQALSLSHCEMVLARRQPDLPVI